MLDHFIEDLNGRKITVGPVGSMNRLDVRRESVGHQWNEETVNEGILHSMERIERRSEEMPNGNAFTLGTHLRRRFLVRSIDERLLKLVRRLCSMLLRRFSPLD